MGGEKRADTAAGAAGKLLDHGPREGKPVEGAGPAPYLVEDDQTALPGLPQDAGRFHHFHHEGALPLCEIVRSAHAGEDAVRKAERRFRSRHERTHLRHDGDDGRLPQDRGLARHVRPSDEHQMALLIHNEVVGDEGGPAYHGFHHGMAALTDAETLPVVEDGARPAVAFGGLGQRLPVVEVGQRIGHEHKAGAFPGNAFPQFLIQAVFKALAAFRGREQPFLQFLELGRGETVAVGKALAALKMLGYGHGLLGARQFEIVAENMVVAQLELGHAVLFLLFAQKLLKHAFAMLHELKELVQLLIIARTEQAAVGDLSRKSIAQGAPQKVGHVLHHVPALHKALEARGESTAFALFLGGKPAFFQHGPGGVERFKHGRQGGEAFLQRGKIVGLAAVQRNARGKALHVIYTVERRAQGLALGSAFLEEGHHVLRERDGFQRPPRAAHTFFEQAAAHRRAGMVHHRPKRACSALAVKAAEKLEIAFRHLVKDEVAPLFQRFERRKLGRVLLLRLLEVGHQRPAGLHEFRAFLKAEGGGFLHVLGGQHPGFGLLEFEMTAEGNAHGLHAVQHGEGKRHVTLVGHEQFARSHLERPLLQLLLAGRLYARPCAGGSVHPREAASRRFGIPVKGAEVIVSLGFEVGILKGRSARDHAGDGALDQPLGLLRVFYLVAYGDLIALFHKLAYVGFGRMPRHAAHGHAALVPAAAGERELKLARGRFGILEEKLVEIAHAIEEQSIGIFLLDFHVLPVHGGKLGLVLAHGILPGPLEWAAL